jgi:hypothetical protein
VTLMNSLHLLLWPMGQQLSQEMAISGEYLD